MRNINIFLIAISIWFFYGCGSNSEKELTSKTLNVKNVLITGEGKNYVKVVDGNYVLKPVDDDLSISIKFETIKKYEGEMNSYTNMGNLSLTPIDSLGATISDIGLSFSPASSNDWDKIRELLTAEPGTQFIITFKWDYFSDKEKQARILNEMYSFEISNTDITNPGGTKNISNNQSNQTNNNNVVISDNNSNVSNEDWDEILDEYEQLVDDYIEYAKQISDLQKKGDDVSASEIATLMPKAMQLNQDAAELGEKLQNASDDLTTAQMTRYTKIIAKFSQAALELSN